jgi:MYXO-CTERM domain-containing protein
MTTFLSRATVVCALVAAVPTWAAVDLAQADNAFDRHWERLPDLRHVRGGQPKDITLTITAEPGEAWTLSADVPWATVTPTSGTGPGTARLRFDGAALNVLDDPTGAVTLVGAVDPDTNRETLTIAWDSYPKVFDGPLITGSDAAALRAYAKDNTGWPKDGFSGGWELWGFLPDSTTHDVGELPIDVAEKTPCAEGQISGCTREGQAGLTAGMKADQGWLLSTGDPAIVIGVLDSGIRWSERDLLEKHYLNARELRSCPPPGADLENADPFRGFDVNGDGMFTIRDYDGAPWLEDINFNGKRDPQDLIWADDGDGACSDDVDDDENGYVDDISGWDFFWNDNDPSDDADFGHGTGEANDSVSEIHDDGGRGGVCPRCLVLNVRVGDSFIVDVNQFAEGAIFVVDSGASVIQEALGSINNTPFAQAAIDYAYFNHVPIVASAADETSYHHNFPGSVERTLYVHAITHDGDNEFESTTFLNFNNCTNFGGHLVLSTPGESCSSEAVGNTAGHVGLMLAYYQQLRERSRGTSDEAYYLKPFTTEEVYQTLNTTAEDIDVEGAEQDPEALALKKFPSNEGWDLHFGYGRNDVRRSLEAIRDQKIPPEANISSPLWFTVFDPDRQPSFDVRASISSPRLTNLRWELHVSEAIVGAPFTKVAEGTGAVGDNQGADDVIATVVLKDHVPGMVARAFDVATGEAEQFSGTLELRVVGENPAGDDVRGVFRKTFGVRGDTQTLPGFPLFLGASGESSPKLTDLDGDGREEIVVATSDGLVHAFKSDGSELAGFPAALRTYDALHPDTCAQNPAKCHRGSRAYQDGVTGGIDPDGVKTSVLATVAVGDLDGDKDACRDVVIATLDGFAFAFDCRGVIRPGFPVTADRTFLQDGVTGARTCDAECQKRCESVQNYVEGDTVVGCRSEQQFGESGFFSSPMLVDLDDDDDLETVIAGLDSRVYAWHHDGTLVAGWPVHLDNPEIPAFDDDGEPKRLVDRIVASPTVADLFGDGTPWVIVGTTEREKNSNSVFLYAIHPTGTERDGGAFPEGWPTTVAGFIPDEILPYVGRGNPNSPAAADFDGDGDDEVINAGMGGVIRMIDGDGRARDTIDFSSVQYGEKADVDDGASLPVINNPSIGDIDNDGFLDVVNGTAGLGLIQVASQGGKRAQFDHGVGAWTDGGFFHDGFPKKAADYQFFMNYAIADVDGDGLNNVVSGDGGYFVWATAPDGTQAPGFPKWTQGWHITTPAVGDLDGDGLMEVVASTREGWLYAWATGGPVGGTENQPAIQWESFHRDDQNTGNASGRFGQLKPYAPLNPPTDGGGCGCTQQQQNPLALAGVAILATLGVWRRRRRA